MWNVSNFYAKLQFDNIFNFFARILNQEVEEEEVYQTNFGTRILGENTAVAEFVYDNKAWDRTTIFFGEESSLIVERIRRRLVNTIARAFRTQSPIWSGNLRSRVRKMQGLETQTTIVRVSGKYYLPYVYWSRKVLVFNAHYKQDYATWLNIVGSWGLRRKNVGFAFRLIMQSCMSVAVKNKNCDVYVGDIGLWLGDRRR